MLTSKVTAPAMSRSFEMPAWPTRLASTFAWSGAVLLACPSEMAGDSTDPLIEVVLEAVPVAIREELAAPKISTAPSTARTEEVKAVPEACA